MSKNFEPQTGAGMGGYKLKPDQKRRIEWLGEMNDRYKELLANEDAPGLFALANDYETKASRPMCHTAHAIRLYAGRMKVK